MTTVPVAQRLVMAQQGGRPIVPVAFHQLKLLQAWQGASLQEMIDTCLALGFTGILFKALDGSMWMDRVDSTPDALGSIEEVRHHAEIAHANGLYFFCWTNPLHSPDMALQATLSGQIARQCDGLFLDVEPYGQFWGANRPVGDAAQFMRWVRQEAPGAFIALQPDPRQGHLDEIRYQEWLKYCDALAGQHYWSDFQTNPTAELAWATHLGEQTGVPILPTLPGNAPGSSFPMASIAGFPGFVVWRWGSTPQSTLELLGSARVAGLRSSRIPRVG